MKFHCQVPFIQLYSTWRSLPFLPKRNLLLLQCVLFSGNFRAVSAAGIGISSPGLYSGGIHCSWSVLRPVVVLPFECFLPFEHKWPPNLPFIWPRMGPAASTFLYHLIGAIKVVLLSPPVWVDWFEIYVTFSLLHPARHPALGERGLDALQMCAAGV